MQSGRANQGVAIRIPSGDLYAELGVAPTATQDEISAAFRARARELHPDAQSGSAPDTENAERFKRVRAAYRVLSDRAERARYDANRRAAPAPVAGAARRPASTATATATGPESEPPQPMLFGWTMTRRRARWILGAGIACLVLAIVVAGWVLADPDTGATDQTARNITLWIVAAKLLVGGVLALLVALRRLRDPLR